MARRDSFGGYEEERFKGKVELVDIQLECSICLKVVKDPVQCPNEHYFCRSCIQKSLRESSEACPMCQHHLTEETLTKPPRILTALLEGLEIRCDHENRGCQEFTKLEFLHQHVDSCGYSPTRCTNVGCAEVTNRNEKERHEREQCDFRKIVCDECGEQVIWKSSRVHPCFLRKEMDDLARRLNVVQNDVTEVKDEVSDVQNDVREVKDEMSDVMNDVREVKDEMSDVQNDVREVKDEMSDVQNDVREVKDEMSDVQNDVREVKDEVSDVQNDVREVKDEVSDVQNDVTEVKEKVERVELTQGEMACITKEAIERYDLFTGRRKIFVCGGKDGQTRLNSVESYGWPENSWTLEAAMKEVRSAPSAFVYGREIYVSGGWDGTMNTDTIESLNVDEECPQWMESAIKMPIKCRAHKMVTHENSAILTGGFTDGDIVSDGIYEISLNPPYNTYLLTQMPEPRRSHVCEIMDNQVMVAGGMTSKDVKDAKNTVYVYDLNNNECKTLTPLSSPVAKMATVSYKGNVILIGGVNEKGQTLNSVVMYDVKTGKIKMLPCLNHKRASSAAVITGNVIIVMGGYDYETKTYLNSVECLDLSTHEWRELSPMTTKRTGLAAVLTPVI